MISFYKKEEFLFLHYEPDNGVSWIKALFANNQSLNLKRTFYLTKNDLTANGLEELNSNNEDNPFEGNGCVNFIVGEINDDYFRIKREILGLKHNLFICKDIDIKLEFFTAYQNMSVFNKIDNLVKEDIYIGGDKETAINLQDFNILLSGFPNSYEVRKYADARVGTVLRNYFDTAIDAESKYKRYLNKKVSQIGENLLESFKENELIKYKSVLDKLNRMLDNEESYNEKQWQNEILDILILLYPKYIAVLPNVKIKDIYNDKWRYLDYLLVDSSGHVDIIEIKQPFDNCIMTNACYRDNYIPVRELSGTVMQIEKYVLYLKSWAKEGEKYLTEKCREKLPDGFEFKIINPIGIIIMGRETGLSKKQLGDFEIVKRKYKNVADIITYDDLIRRLKNLIDQFENRVF